MSKPNPEFLVGFEIEVAVANYKEADHELNQFVKKLYDNKAVYGNDGSVGAIKLENHYCHYDYIDIIGREIKTPPLPIEEARIKLRELFAHLKVLAKKNRIEINETCGFHVNVSEKNLFTSRSMKDKEKIVFFAFWFARHFNSKKWLKYFKRNDCEYCINYEKPTTIDDITLLEDHYSAVNLENLYNSPKEKRIEVRVAGNKNYHSSRGMDSFLKHVFSTMEKAYEKTHTSDIKKYRNHEDSYDNGEWYEPF